MTKSLLAVLLALVWVLPLSAQGPTDQPSVYVVQEGDTLADIARRFGTTVGAISAANGISDPGLISIGQELIIPVEGVSEEPLPSPEPSAVPTEVPSVYVVQAGDTLVEIAARFGTTVEALAQANDIVDAALIVEGQKLVIPTGEPAQGATPQPTRISRQHQVRPGELLPSLALRYGTTVWALRAANGLHRLGVLVAEQEILIPAPTVAMSTTPGLPLFSTRPSPAIQGQTVVLKVESRRPLALYGTLLGRDLRFYDEGGGTYWTLAGIDADSEPGGIPVTVWARELSTGDLLTVESMLEVGPGSFSTYDVAVPADRQGLLDPALTEKESELVGEVFGQVTQPRLWAGQFRGPLDGELVTSAPFGQRRSYAGGPVSSYHAGQDYHADAGASVFAPAAGTVVLAQALQVRGKAVILDHGCGVFSGFWHLSEIRVTVGQTVGQGEVVGLVGSTGLSTGPHLHWEMRVAGVPVDPAQWMQQAFP